MPVWHHFGYVAFFFSLFFSGLLVDSTPSLADIFPDEIKTEKIYTRHRGNKPNG